MWKQFVCTVFLLFTWGAHAEAQTSTDLLALDPLPPTIMAMSPDRKQLATNASTGFDFTAKGDKVAAAIEKWRDNTQAVKVVIGGEYKKIGEHASCIVSLGWSPDGKVLASGDEAGVVQVWNVAQRQATLELKGHIGAVRNTLFSSDGKWLVAGDGYSRQGQPCFPTAAGKSMHTLDYVYLGGLSPVVGTPVGKKLTLWDAATGNAAHEFETDSPLLLVWFSPDSSQLWTTEVDRKIIAWNVATGQPVASWLTPTPLLDAISSKDGERIYTLGFEEHFVRVWQHNGKEEGQLKVASVAALRRPILLQLSDDDKHLMAQTGVALNESARTVQAMRIPFALGTATVSERVLPMVSSDGEVNVWKLPASRPVYFGPPKGAKLDELGLQDKGPGGFFRFPRR